mgnify:CR=1 FL=1
MTIVYESTTPIVVATGFKSPEGPSFDRRGLLYLVDWDAKRVYRISRTGDVEAFAATGGVPTGSKFHRNGNLLVADGEQGILEITPNGTIRAAATEWQGQPFRGPNDLVFAFNGDLYFTDPKGSDTKRPIGRVFILRQDGRVERFAGGFQFPNGVVLSNDGKRLYLAETLSNRIWAFELDSSGRERSRRLFAQLEGGLGPDGMASDQDGNLFVAHFGKGVVTVLDATGRIIAELPTAGAKPTNVAFWGSSLYVTEVERGQVVRLDVGVEGQLVYGLS